MNDIPTLDLPDNSIPFITEGYPFLHKKFKELNTDIFKTRMALQKVICITGKDAAELFYDSTSFIRKDVVPDRLGKTLFGHGGVHGLDDEDHRHRKAMFMKMMIPENLQEIKKFAEDAWKEVPDKYRGKTTNLLELSQEVLFKSIYTWAGVPITKNDVKERSKEAFTMIDAFGGLLKRHQKGVTARNSHEEWLGDVIKKIRNGDLEIEKRRPAYIIAHHKDRNGNLLDIHTASVELSNATRPAIALSIFVTFGGLVMEKDKSFKKKLATADNDYLKCFVHEIRRYYPFVPFLGAKAKQSLEWKGYRIPEGQLVLLDVYGILHDPRLWDEPYAFKPERFLDWDESPYTLIPQGGGDFDMGHRCAGEWVSITLLKEAFKALAGDITYDVPKQDLEYSLKRFPTYPAEGLKITNIRKLFEATVQ